MTSNHKQTSSAFNSPFKKRMAVGAVTVMTAGSLLGLGVVGASATPLDSSAGGHSSSHGDVSAEGGQDFLGSLSKELRADLKSATDADKAQNVSDTLEGHPELFQSLPANLQADLTALNDATADQAAAADKIETTALDGGYGEQIQSVAAAIQQDPTHPIGAALRALAGSDVVESQPTAASADKIATTLVENPALFEQLPADLQSDLTELQSLPETDRATGADAILADALDGGYGPEVQKIAEQIQTSIDGDVGAGAEGDTEADADVTADDADVEADADVKTDGTVKADN